MKGQGFVTSVDGSSYTVLVSEGEFLVDDSVNIYRDSSYSLVSSLGRGSISRVSPTAVTGSGLIVSFAVQPGDEVKRGQLLFETVEGSFTGAEIKGSEILAGTDGVIASLNLEEGASVSQNGLVASIYPKDAVWVSAEVPEADLRELQVGQKVRVELDWNQEMGVSYEGTVEMISSLGTVGEESTTYPVYVSFTPDENTRYSMTAVVTTLDDSGSAGAKAPAEPETVEEEVDLDGEDGK